MLIIYSLVPVGHPVPKYSWLPLSAGGFGWWLRWLLRDSSFNQSMRAKIIFITPIRGLTIWEQHRPSTSERLNDRHRLKWLVFKMGTISLYVRINHRDFTRQSDWACIVFQSQCSINNFNKCLFIFNLINLWRDLSSYNPMTVGLKYCKS